MPLRGLFAAAVLAVAAGAALHQGLLGGRSARVPAAALSHGLTHESLLSLPLAAQGPVSAALGSSDPAYRIQSLQGVLRASNPRQDLTATFARAGVSVIAGASRVGLTLEAVGYGSRLEPVSL